MSLIITQSPGTSIGDLTSKWNAVRNPVVYKFQRKDFVFDQINDASTFIQLQFTGVDISASFSVDDLIYIQSDNGVYDLFSVVTASAFSGGNTLVTVEDLYISAAPGGFVNNETTKPQYRVNVQVYGDDGNIGDVHIYSPNTKGLLLIDVSDIVKQELTAEIEADLTSTSEIIIDDTGHYISFAITTTEVWTGSAESPLDDVTAYYAVHSATQIPSAYGGNLGDYVILSSIAGTDYGTQIHSRTSVGTSESAGQSVVPDETELVKVRTNASANTGGASSVVATVNLIFELNSVIVLTIPIGNFNLGANASQSTGQNITYLTTADFGSGGFDNYYIEVIVNSGSGTFTVQGNVNVYHDLILPKLLTKLTRPKAWIGYPFITSMIIDDGMDENFEYSVQYNDKNGSVISSAGSTGVTTFAGKQVILYPSALLAIPENAATAVIIGYNSDVPIEITEQKTFDIVQPCQNPVMLIARNSLGGVLQWLFEVSQEEDYNYGNDIKRKRQLLSAAGLTKNEWDSLHDFITLGEVYRENLLELTSSTNKTSKRIDQQVYVIDEDGNEIGVVVIPNRNRTQTKLQQHYFEIEIEYPEVF